MFWKNWHVVPKTLYAPWDSGAPNLRLTFFSVLRSWRTTISVCTSGVSYTITTFPWPFCGPDIPELQNLTWRVSRNLVWTDREIPGMGHLGIFSMSIHFKRKRLVCVILLDLILSWVPSMLSQLEAKAPLEFCVGALPALEILLSLMSCSGFWYLSTSVALPPLTAWTDLAEYLRGWCSSHSMILITLQLCITWKEGVFNVWYCPQSTLRNYKIIIQAFKFPCHQCVCIVSRMK